MLHLLLLATTIDMQPTPTSASALLSIFIPSDAEMDMETNLTKSAKCKNEASDLEHLCISNFPDIEGV